MSKLLKALLVTATIATASQSFAGNFLDIPPAEGLPVCAGVYATMQAYAKDPENKRILQNRSTTIAMASKRFNPNGPNDALALARDNISRINAGDMNTSNNVIAAEKNCRAYTAKYGI